MYGLPWVLISLDEVKKKMSFTKCTILPRCCFSKFHQGRPVLTPNMELVDSFKMWDTKSWSPRCSKYLLGSCFGILMKSKKELDSNVNYVYKYIYFAFCKQLFFLKNTTYSTSSLSKHCPKLVPSI